MATATLPISNLTAALAEAPTHSPIANTPDAGHHEHPDPHSAKDENGGLITPPDSFSPNAPSPPVAIPAGSQGPRLQLTETNLSSLRDAQKITPQMLAKHYLPKILADQGPMTVGTILGKLNEKLPGFSSLPSAKSRRLVTAALENKQHGGVRGEFLFLKVSWGVWEGRRRDSTVDSTADSDHLGVSVPRSGSRPPFSRGLRHSRINRSRVRGTRSPLMSPDVNHPEDEADKMSLDGFEELPVTSRPRERSSVPVNQAPEDDDATDEEDWEAIGPAGLRSASYAASYGSIARSNGMTASPRSHIPFASPRTAPPRNMVRKPSQQRNVSFPGFSVDAARDMAFSGGIVPFKKAYTSSLTTAIRASSAQASSAQGTSAGSPEDQEAAQALLSMGSM